jgi:hypothetical protein
MKSEDLLEHALEYIYELVNQDDDTDMLEEQQENFVRTDCQVGLTVEDCQKVINILK